MTMAAKINVEREIRRAVDTGSVEFGYRQAEKNALKGIGKIIIISESLDRKQREKLKHVAKLSGIPVIEVNKTSQELGSICGQPFPVSAMVVLKLGKSKLMSSVKE
jgi:large subunit ribosomal protein L30e